MYYALLVDKTVLRDDIFFPLWCIEINGKFNSLGLIDSQRQV